MNNSEKIMPVVGGNDGEIFLYTIPEYILNAFTWTDGKTILDVDCLKTDGLESKSNNFNLDEEGDLTVKSISSNSKGFNVLEAYPVGSIYLSVNDVNPTNLFGGNWVNWGIGRVPIGVDDSQNEFSDVEQIGGEKTHTLSVDEIPSHTHVQNQHRHLVTNGTYTYANGSVKNAYALKSKASSLTPDQSTNQYSDYTTAVNQNTGGGQSHNNLPPYITCYMWKRIA